MNTVSSIYVKQTRLAQHYLDKLRSAHRVYSRGNDHAVYGLKLAEQDWLQIQQWQSWAASHAAHQPDAAELCVAYPQAAGDLLDILITPREHRIWREVALAEARRLGDVGAELAHLLALGGIYLKLGEYDRTDAAIREALELAHRHQDRQSRAHGLWILGYNAYFRNHFTEAQTFHQQSLEICRSLNDQAGIARNLIGLVNIMERRGEYSGTIRDYAEESLHIFRKLGDHRGTAQALTALAKSLKNDDPERAVAYLQQGLQHVRQVGNLNDMVDLYITLSKALALAKHYHLATTMGEEALRIFRQQGSRHGVMVTLRNLSSCSIMMGDFDAARRFAEQSLEIARELKDDLFIGVNLMNMGTISNILQEHKRAYGELIQAEASLRHIEAPVDLAYTLVALASAHRGMGDAEKTRVCLCEALAILDNHSLPLAVVLAVINVAALYLMVGEAERGAVLLGMADAHPQTPGTVRKFGIGRVRCAAEELLGVETVARLMKKGAKQDFQATVAVVRAELEERDS